MIVGTVRVEFHIPESSSLKARRSVVNKLKQRLASRFNASVAEVDCQDLWQRAAIGVAVVASDKVLVESVLTKMVNMVEAEPSIQVVSVDVQFY